MILRFPKSWGRSDLSNDRWHPWSCWRMLRCTKSSMDQSSTMTPEIAVDRCRSRQKMHCAVGGQSTEGSLHDVRVTPVYWGIQDHSLLCSFNIWKHSSRGSVRPPLFTVEGGANEAKMWPAYAVAWRSNPALAQVVVGRTNYAYACIYAFPGFK